MGKRTPATKFPFPGENRFDMVPLFNFSYVAPKLILESSADEERKFHLYKNIDRTRHVINYPGFRSDIPIAL